MLTDRYSAAIHYGRRNSKFRNSLSVRSGDTYLLAAVVSGEASLHGSKGRRQLEVPCAVFLPPRTQWELVSTRGSEWSCLVFDVARVPLRRGERNSLHHVRPAPQPCPEDVWGVVPPELIPSHHMARALKALRFCNDTWWRDDWDYARANAHLHAWLTDYVAISRYQDRDTLADALQPLAEAIDKGMEQGINTVSLAATSGMTRQQLHRIFVNNAGTAPGQYIFQKRMDRAATLLRTSDRKILDVARICGYRSRSTFCHQFRRHYGCTPTEWRADHLDP